LDRQGIPDLLLRHRALGETPGKDREDVDGDVSSQSSSDDELEKDVISLRNFSFISVDINGTMFGVHRLVQLATQKWLEINSQLEIWKQRSVRMLEGVFPTAEHSNWPTCEILFPHVKLAAIERPKSEYLTIWARLLYKAASFALLKGNAMDAISLAKASTEARKIEFGPKDHLTLNSMGALAMAYNLGGKWNKAEELEEQVMEMRKTILGLEHPYTLISMASLATIYSHKGRWDEAEELRKQVLKTSKRVLGLEHPHTLICMANLASTYNNKGRWDDAEKLEEQVLEMSKRLFGLEHPHTLICMANLA
jgi:tetratricopeptide (TPR) repeat protein